jgi:hypothetical protein
MRFGEALRALGMDEFALAGRMIGISNTLADKSSSEGAGNREKLHLEVLKEFTKHLDPPRPTSGPGAPFGASGEPPVIVQLMHNVPRPERTPSPSSPPSS